MINFWRKDFIDSHSIFGIDDLIKTGKGGWRKTKLHNMNGVFLQDCCILNKCIQLQIIGLGDYWQEDDCIVEFGDPEPRRVARRIMKLIEPSEYFCELIVENNSIVANFINPKSNFFSVSFGKWFIVEVNQNGLRHYVSLSR